MSTIPPYQLRAQQPRPHAWWWVLGGTLSVVGVALGTAVWVLGFFGAIGATARTDAVVAADGTSHAVRVTPHTRRTLWTSSLVVTPRCRVSDGSGPLRVTPRSSSASVTIDGDSWFAFARVPDTGDGLLSVTCAGGGRVRVSPPLDLGSRLRQVAVGLGTAVLVSVAGILVLVVTTIRWVGRAPR